MGESVNWTLNDIAVHPGLYNYGDDMLADLQLAAELGKTLLERNKELEGSLRQKQTIIDDQKQEIEYLTKQTAALREVSDSRLRIYEQLEVSIQDLERQNHRLVLDNSSNKKHIKTLTATIENLEGKCEELQTTIDELRLQIDVFKRRSSRISDQQLAQNPPSNTVALRHIDRNISDNETEITAETEQQTLQQQLQDDDGKGLSSITKTTETTQQLDGDGEEIIDENVEQISQLMAQLRECKTQSSRDQRRITELEEQLSTLIQQNQALENQVIQLHHSHDDEKSMYDELSTLEEVRKGQMCSRCLRNIDKSDELLEDDDSSMLDELMSTSQHRASFTMDIQESTPNTSTPGKNETGHLYKDLVEKYEALLEVHRQPVRNNQQHNKDVSLHEELQMSSDFNPSIKDTDDESGHGDSLKPEKQHTTTKTTTNNNNKTRQAVSHTPTDFSETETSSSGFSDETYNKSTQTEDRGSYLWTIADGDDCKFSIYDDTSPVTSRFKNRPEYQQLFKEIFTVLKNTTEPQKPSEIEKDNEQIAERQINNPPEFINQYDEDSQSIVSSTMSELSLSQNEPTTIIENIIQSQNQPIPEPEIVTTIEGTATTTITATSTTTKEDRVLRPLVRQPLEYLSVEVRKRSSSRRKHKYQQDRSDSPVTHIIGSPKICYTNRPTSGRRRGRNDTNQQSQPPQQQQQKQNVQEIDTTTWNGSTLQFWSTNRNLTSSPTPSQGSGKVCFEFRPSSASQDLHKLKKLDLSYAQVLRNADNKKKHRPNRK